MDKNREGMGKIKGNYVKKKERSKGKKRERMG